MLLKFQVWQCLNFTHITGNSRTWNRSFPFMGFLTYLQVYLYLGIFSVFWDIWTLSNILYISWMQNCVCTLQQCFVYCVPSHFLGWDLTSYKSSIQCPWYDYYIMVKTGKIPVESSNWSGLGTLDPKRPVSLKFLNMKLNLHSQPTFMHTQKLGSLFHGIWTQSRHYIPQTFEKQVLTRIKFILHV